ncbi:MAG TPA: hypothetical protein DCL40_03170, partial [Coxiellaceae bacterium]|nr:hypothetical protein [Coxiellaceae bacterium]
SLYTCRSAEDVAYIFDAIPGSVTEIILDENDIDVILDLINTTKNRMTTLINSKENITSSIITEHQIEKI